MTSKHKIATTAIRWKRIISVRTCRTRDFERFTTFAHFDNKGSEVLDWKRGRVRLELELFSSANKSKMSFAQRVARRRIECPEKRLATRVSRTVLNRVEHFACRARPRTRCSPNCDHWPWLMTNSQTLIWKRAQLSDAWPNRVFRKRTVLERF